MPQLPHCALPNLVKFNLLNLNGCSITEPGYIQLSQSQLLDQIEYMGLTENQIESNRGTEALFKTSLFSNMKSISLDPLVKINSKLLTHLDKVI